MKKRKCRVKIYVLYLNKMNKMSPAKCVYKFSSNTAMHSLGYLCHKNHRFIPYGENISNALFSGIILVKMVIVKVDG